MMDIFSFLCKNIEGYLFADMEAMVLAEHDKTKGGGGLGYPLLMTAFSGIELLGALLSSDRFNPRSGAKYFEEYWTTYLYPEKQEGGQIAQYFYQLGRHGIAHAYVVKGQIAVVKQHSEKHLTRDENNLVYIDAVVLSIDLKKSYYDSVRPLIESDSNSETMQERLSEIEKCYKKQADNRNIKDIFSLSEKDAPSEYIHGSSSFEKSKAPHSMDSDSTSAHREGPTGPTFPTASTFPKSS